MLIFIAAFRWQPLCNKQSQLLHKHFRKKMKCFSSLFLQKYLKFILVVQTTASPTTTTRCVFCPLVYIILYYLETLKSSLGCWMDFVSPINTWTFCIHYSSNDSVEKFLQRVDKSSITCNEQLILITETREWTECRALQKRGS